MNRRKALKIFGLGTAATASTVVASTVGISTETLDKSLEEKTIVINGVKSLDVKNTTLYKKFISDTVEVIVGVGEAIGEISFSEVKEEDIDFICEFSKDDIVDGDISIEVLNVVIESLRDMSDDACSGGSGVNYGDFKSIWMTGFNSFNSASLLLKDFEDEIPENILDFYEQGEDLTSNYQSCDFNI